jgi:Family of unknown function (DUF6399)
VRQRLEGLACPEEVRGAVRELLLPGRYLELAAARASTAAERQRWAKLGAALCQRARDGPLAAVDAAIRAAAEAVATECAGLFQRSSSCVEGRNGQLALRHHGWHRLSTRKLATLTVLHNFFIERRDGTTAAERFYGRRPRDVFAYVLERLPVLARPARRRRSA